MRARIDSDVVIRSSNDILRVYRVRNDGQLKRLVNVPDGIEVAKQVAAGDSLLASNGNETPAVLPDDDDDDDDERQVFTIKDPATKQGQQRIGVLRRKADALSVHLGNTAEMLRVLDLEAIKTHAPEMVGWIQRAAAKLRRDLRHLDGF